MREPVKRTMSERRKKVNRLAWEKSFTKGLIFSLATLFSSTSFDFIFSTLNTTPFDLIFSESSGVTGFFGRTWPLITVGLLRCEGALSTGFFERREFLPGTGETSLAQSRLFSLRNSSGNSGG